MYENHQNAASVLGWIAARPAANQGKNTAIMRADPLHKLRRTVIRQSSTSAPNLNQMSMT